MKTQHWVINWENEKAQYNKNLRLAKAVERQKSYKGFRIAMEKEMFKEELEDLAMVYKKALIETNELLENCLPLHIHYMQEFIKLHKQKEAISEKLSVLIEKTNKETKQNNDEQDDE